MHPTTVKSFPLDQRHGIVVPIDTKIRDIAIDVDVFRIPPLDWDAHDLRDQVQGRFGEICEAGSLVLLDADEP